jgi:hypothetical protein
VRKFLITAVSAASLVAVVGMAPSALASDESAQFASLNSGVPVSGMASSTAPANGTVYYMKVDFPTANFTAQFGSGADFCTTYGITIEHNGAPVALDSCDASYRIDSGQGLPERTRLYVQVAVPINATAGDVFTLSWGSGWVTTAADLSGTTMSVYEVTTGIRRDVTPTLASPMSSSSGSSASPILMWQQSYGRASASDTCQSGYTPSWDTWPNGGKGGFVCNRFVPEYGN